MGKAQTRAKNKYNKANYDTVLVSMPKGTKAQLKAVAQARGVSVNALFNCFIAEVVQGDGLSAEIQKVETELAQEAQTMHENLEKFHESTLNAAAVADDEWLIRKKGYSPMPTDKLLKYWADMVDNGHSYDALSAYTETKTGHRYEPKTIYNRVNYYRLTLESKK